MNVAPYRKLVVAVGGVCALAVAAVSDGTLTGAEIGEVIGGAITAYLVFRVPNEDLPTP